MLKLLGLLYDDFIDNRSLISPRTSQKGGGWGVKWTPIGFSDLKFENFKQSK